MPKKTPEQDLYLTGMTIHTDAGPIKVSTSNSAIEIERWYTHTGRHEKVQLTAEELRYIVDCMGGWMEAQEGTR